LEPASYSEFAWLDAHRLLIGEWARGPGPQQVILYQWQADSGRTLFEPRVSTWCAGDGIVSYRTTLERKSGSASRATFLSGVPGKLTETKIDFDAVVHYARLNHTAAFQWYGPGDSYRQSPFDCRWVKSEKLSGPKRDRTWMPLRDGDGFLSFVQPDGRPAEYILYYPSEDSEPITTMITARYVQTHGVRYVPFRDAYFISPIAVGPKGKETLAPCISMWWFRPQSRQAEEICVPTDSLNANDVTYAPSAIGLIRTVSYHRASFGQKPGGLYLTSPDGRSEQIFEGRGAVMGVSPDGCSVAIMSSGADLRSSSFSVMELCTVKPAG
jgi:hypothetical protein